MTEATQNTRLKAVDIQAELSNLPFIRGRSPYTSEAEMMSGFTNLSPYRDGGIFAGGFSGTGQWERHLQGEEIVHILDGATTLTIMTDHGPQSFEMTAGMIIVVPQGCWHQFHAPDGVTLMTVTPQPTEHISGDDPRSIELSARLQ